MRSRSGSHNAALRSSSTISTSGELQPPSMRSGPRSRRNGARAAADLSSAAGCNRLVEQVPDCDILVNNAAIYETADFFEIPDATSRGISSQHHVRGPVVAAYLPNMGARDWGRVVFISSECGISTPPDMLHYAVTKTALFGLSRGLAKRMSGTGVTVNAVLPG